MLNKKHEFAIVILKDTAQWVGRWLQKSAIFFIAVKFVRVPFLNTVETGVVTYWVFELPELSQSEAWPDFRGSNQIRTNPSIVIWGTGNPDALFLSRTPLEVSTLATPFYFV